MGPRTRQKTEMWSLSLLQLIIYLRYFSSKSWIKLIGVFGCFCAQWTTISLRKSFISPVVWKLMLTPHSLTNIFEISYHWTNRQKKGSLYLLAKVNNSDYQAWTGMLLVEKGHQKDTTSSLTCKLDQSIWRLFIPPSPRPTLECVLCLSSPSWKLPKDTALK